MREVFGDIFADVWPPPAKDDEAILDSDGVVRGDVTDVAKHDLTGQDTPRQRANLREKKEVVLKK